VFGLPNAFFLGTKWFDKPSAPIAVRSEGPHARSREYQPYHRDDGCRGCLDGALDGLGRHLHQATQQVAVSKKPLPPKAFPAGKERMLYASTAGQFPSTTELLIGTVVVLIIAALVLVWAARVHLRANREMGLRISQGR
jgi:hypothetical protein